MTIRKCFIGLLAAPIFIASALLIQTPANANSLQSWDKVINRASRFKVLKAFDNEAVLDKETQLVWEISPTGGLGWLDAVSHCYNRVIGGRMGWRLPTIEELTTLVDLQTSSPSLPDGNPFDAPPTPPVWSITSDAEDNSYAWSVNFADGTLHTDGKGAAEFAWCVRGGHGYDGQMTP